MGREGGRDAWALGLEAMGCISGTFPVGPGKRCPEPLRLAKHDAEWFAHTDRDHATLQENQAARLALLPTPDRKAPRARSGRPQGVENETPKEHRRWKDRRS